jgi:arylsulfatase A
MVVEQNLQNNLSITDGEWKYIPASEGPIMNEQTNTELGNNSVDQLYNLLSDPGEQKNGKRVKGMSAELKRIIESGIHYKVLR